MEGVDSPLNRSTVALGLAAALVLTSATQLRAVAIPLGIGEVALVGALLAIAARWYVQDGPLPRLRGFFEFACGFWLIALVGLSSGAILALVFERFPLETAVHDTAALLLAATASILVAGYLQEQGAAASFARYLLLLTVLCAAGLFVAGLAIGTLGPVELWYLGVRFRGWAENPNQFALLLVLAPFVGMQLAADDPYRRVRFLALMLTAMAIGATTLSDALVLAWAAALGGLALVKWLRVLTGRSTSGALLFFGVLLPIVAIAALLPFVSTLLMIADGFLRATYEEGGQGSLRLTIWKHGVDALMQSPIFGWGPGRHSGMWGPHGDMEAHNTFIDWAASAGIAGLAGYLFLLVAAFRASWRAQKLFLAFGVIAVAAFSCFHYVLRQPLFWVYLILAYEYSRAALIARWHSAEPQT